ncbi:PaaI family thioesterase [Ramlibacter tataouinensis]|uniref:Thioesterase domain-containing protein n=1 Tax=Ramlibacter tataouinensis (strain ATCC BAA-407 / DSM 14655 / LMG 21543 / TTB310) TaxID=365046 RepID=F5XVI5_RAMTT|nr:PaaI family thioesterase [Ramlibacter tataouinensis]AEG91561.1 Conserved hypothetical protein [Ramlibacter tataouinensis TTB310]
MNQQTDRREEILNATRTRTFTWEDPHKLFGIARTMSGLELMRKMMGGEIRLPPIMELVDFRLRRVDPGEVDFVFMPQEFHFSPIGTVHGGIACTLLDSAMSCGVYAAIPAGAAFTTLQLNVNLIRPITLESGELRCEGKVAHLGARTATAEARLVDSGGRLYAHSSTTCMIFPATSK